MTLSNTVKSLQQALVAGGAGIKVDGLMGLETYYAAMHAQNGVSAKADEAKAKKTPENRVTAPVAQKSRRIELIVIHSTATPAGMHVDVDLIRQWHLDRGFNDVGYHYVICRDGACQAGRKEHQSGAHVKGHNARSIGIALAGGARNRDGKLVSDNNFTVKQWDTLARALRELKEKYPDAEIKGHRDLAATACPSFDVQSWAAAVL